MPVSWKNRRIAHRVSSVNMDRWDHVTLFWQLSSVFHQSPPHRRPLHHYAPSVEIPPRLVLPQQSSSPWVPSTTTSPSPKLASKSSVYASAATLPVPTASRRTASRPINSNTISSLGIYRSCPVVSYCVLGTEAKSFAIKYLILHTRRAALPD